MKHILALFHTALSHGGFVNFFSTKAESFFYVASASCL